MIKILIVLLLSVMITSFTKPPTEEKRTKICQTVGFCTACYATTTIRFPRGEQITVWEITASCSGNAPVVIADGWFKEIE